MVLDFAVHVVHPMTVRDVLSIITFISFDTNGTVLVAAVYERAMSNIPRFKSLILKKGLYSALVCLLLEIAKRHGSTCPGSSQKPRYNYPADRTPMSNSSRFVSKAFCLCTELSMEVRFQNKKQFQDWKTSHNTSKTKLSTRKLKAAYRDFVCGNFLKDLQEAAGKGVGPILSFTFFQLCTLLGILPTYLYGWAHLTKGSGGYGFIRSKCEAIGISCSLEQSNKWMNDCYELFSNAMSPNAHLGLLENMLCEFKREDASKNGQSKKKDCLFVLHHRGREWQNMYRLEFKSATNVRLYIHPGQKGLKALGNKKVSMDIGSWKVFPSSKIEELPEDHHVLCWNNRADKDANTLLMNSTIHVSSGLMDCSAIARWLDIVLIK